MTFYIKDLEIYYETHGEGEPLILLNGIMMSTASWHVFNNAFVGFKRITLDFYDQGKSSDHENYTIEDQAEILFHLIKELHLEQFHLVGISYGGEVALAFATQFPSMIKTLHLFNTAIYTDTHLYQLGTTWLKLTLQQKGDQFYEATIPNIYGQTFKKNNVAWLKERESHLREVFSNHAFLNRMHRLTQSSQHTDLRRDAHRIMMPTQIISGLEDQLIPIQYQEEILNYIPHAVHKKLPHIGHATMYEDQGLFEHLITSFIKQNGGTHT